MNHQQIQIALKSLLLLQFFLSRQKYEKNKNYNLDYIKQILMAHIEKKLVIYLHDAFIIILDFFNSSIKENSMDIRILRTVLVLIFISLVSSTGVLVLNPGCKRFDNGNICAQCSDRYYKDNQGICQPVNQNCKTYNGKDGACTSCYDGFFVVEDACLPVPDSQLLALAEALSNCNQIADDNTCKRCSVGFYFDEKRICKKIPDSCANFDINSGKCRGCYQGYSLNQKNECSLSTETQNNDPGCSTFVNKKCIKCSTGFYFDKNNICKMIPPTCSSFNAQAALCQACYSGYTLDKDRNCVISQAKAPSDFGCTKFENGKCTKCSFGYYFNKNRVCQQIPPLCGNYDTKNQICLACYPGYILDSNNICVYSASTVSDPGCSLFSNGVCVKCSFGYYFNKANVCKMIPPICKGFDVTRQICNECYPGYSPDSTGVCIENIAPTVDSGCSRFQKGICVKCSFGYYFKNKQCRVIPPTCSKFDPQREQCLSCYVGYALDSSNTCIRKIETISDAGCNKFQNGKCIACSQGFYFTSLGVCQQIPTTCSNFDSILGLCKACYEGYELNTKNECIVKAAVSISDPNCKQFKNNRCVQCSMGAFFDSQGKCVLSDPLCKKINQVTRRCQQCYHGYEVDLIQNGCRQAQIIISDPNCKVFKNNQCVQCSFRYFKDSSTGKCQTVDPLCRLFSPDSGQCTSCYEGYVINPNNRRKCEKDTTAAGSNCAQWRNNKCIKCAFGAYFTQNGFCENVDPLCLTWNQSNGQCKSCYPSFDLSFGKCILSTKKSYTDKNCAKFNEKQQCTQCSRGFYFGFNNICTQVDPLCSTFDSTFGRCLTCYSGYKVNNGRCIEDVQMISDLNCAKFQNSICVQCSRGYYFNSQKRCEAINPQCHYFNYEKKRCQDCYPGYVIFNGQCVKGTKDKLCAEWKESICIRCVSRAYFSDLGTCQSVNDYCKDFDVFDGLCLTCYRGFQLKNGQCTRQTSSNGCIQYSQNSQCSACQRRRYLERGVCKKIDDLCDSFNFIKNQCISCYTGYTLIDGKCLIAEISQDQQVANCYTYSMTGKCIECFERFYLKDNTCNSVSVFCKKYNPTSGQCTDCYSGFNLSKGKCIRK